MIALPVLFDLQLVVDSLVLEAVVVQYRVLLDALEHEPAQVLSLLAVRVNTYLLRVYAEHRCIALVILGRDLRDVVERAIN